MKSAFVSLLIIALIGFVGIGTVRAEDDPAHSVADPHAAPAVEQTPATAEHAAAEHATDGHGGQHEEGVGAVIIHSLTHHLVDAEKFELFGLILPLPTVTIGPFRLITKHQVWWLIAMLLVLLATVIAGRQKTTVPTGLRNAFEVLIVFIRDEVLKPNLHGRTDAFLPYFLSLFTCIFFSNLLGLLPWGTTSTGNINVTAGLSLCTLGLMIGMGVLQNGVRGFLAEFTPPGVPLWLMPLMVIVEIASFMIRPFALTIRLFANMLAGHAVIAVVLALIVTPIFALPSVAVATFVTLLEILVALIQAYIFCILTAVFTGLAMHPAH
ncbi:F0F1 ATP synthase subunit A [bacterium]|nr:F0F1 ATP synthase subunit A [bacterium]MBU1983695.1 F0F1 ATP synthase subunit A [bacterium]